MGCSILSCTEYQDTTDNSLRQSDDACGQATMTTRASADGSQKLSHKKVQLVSEQKIESPLRLQEYDNDYG